MIKMLIAMGALMAAAPAMATDWQAVAVSDNAAGDTGVFVVDKDSIRTAAPNRQSAHVFLISSSGSYMETTMEGDCQTQMVRWLDGRMVMNGAESRASGGNWNKVIPGSAYDGVLTYLCSGGKPRHTGYEQGFGAGDPVQPALAWVRKQKSK